MEKPSTWCSRACCGWRSPGGSESRSTLVEGLVVVGEEIVGQVLEPCAKADSLLGIAGELVAEEALRGALAETAVGLELALVVELVASRLMGKIRVLPPVVDDVAGFF